VPVGSNPTLSESLFLFVFIYLAGVVGSPRATLPIFARIFAIQIRENRRVSATWVHDDTHVAMHPCETGPYRVSRLADTLTLGTGVFFRVCDASWDNG
jgi:hypothetical protein